MQGVTTKEGFRREAAALRALAQSLRPLEIQGKSYFSLVNKSL